MLTTAFLFFVATSTSLLTQGSAFSVGVPPSTISTSSNKQWKPKVANVEDRKEVLRGQQYSSEVIGSLRFHHVEFYCQDAITLTSRFALGLGMNVVGMTGQQTGNDQCVSYALSSNNVNFLITAPYSRKASSISTTTTTTSSSSNQQQDEQQQQQEYDSPLPLPGFSNSAAHEFLIQHGVAARAVGLLVRDAEQAFRASVERGAVPVLEPTFVPTCRGQKHHDKAKQQQQLTDLGTKEKTGCTVAEVKLYGDVVLRYVSFPDQQGELDGLLQEEEVGQVPFLPHLAPVKDPIGWMTTGSYGLQRIDHAVGNVPNLQEALEYVSTITGFHEFAEFTADDVGTMDSGLNSVVLASDSEYILLPMNEPTEGKRKSQIQTFLEQNEGPGLQHLALKTNDIFTTIRRIKEAEERYGGFQLMKPANKEYYRELPTRLGDQLTAEQYKQIEELGLLADADDEGVLLQIFTKPISDRPTFFFEIIQRIGCPLEEEEEDASDASSQAGATGIEQLPSNDKTRAIQVEWNQRPGCGGFGKGNFRALFKSIEEHEKTLKI